MMGHDLSLLSRIHHEEKFSLCILIIVLVGTLLISSNCRSEISNNDIEIPKINANYNPIPQKEREQPLPGEEQPDDFVPTPGGGFYRANVDESGVENQWEPIEVVSKVMGSGDNAIEVQYRDYIETRAGEARNNIIYVLKVDGAFTGSDRNLGLFTLDVPPGIELTLSDGPSPKANMAGMLVIDISPDIVLGKYPLEIGLVVNDIDYGTITCTVEVVE